MYEVTCLDLDGNTINNFFQWDVDQSVVIKLKGCDPNLLTIAPEAHFSNASRDEALVVRASVNSSKDTITATIPNILLQEPYPLLIYIYLTDSEDVSSQKTILYSEVPVRKRAKPSDYLYVENITRITADNIKAEIEASTESTRTQAIQDITTTKNDAIAVVTQKKEDFITTGESLVTSATGIKNNTQTTYENTVAVANQTQTQIESDINSMMLDNGLTLKTSDDGSGNITLSVIVNQS